MPVSQPGDMWLLGRTDTPYNVPNAGHVTAKTHHREFAMATGAMSREEFAAFLHAWMMAAAAHVLDDLQEGHRASMLWKFSMVLQELQRIPHQFGQN